MAEKILLGRRCAGFGDSVLFADVILTLNKSYPHLLIDVIDNGKVRLDLLDCCGCKYTPVKLPNYPYVGRCIHSVYNTRPVEKSKHLLTSMLENLCRQIPCLDFRSLDPVMAKPVVESDYKVPEGEYVVVPHYTTPFIGSRPKDYPRDKFGELVKLMSVNGFRVYELNASHRQEQLSYKYSSGMLTATSPVDTAKILSKARFVVTTEGGVMHWACHNDARCYTIFKSRVHADPSSVQYSTMVPILCYKDESPAYIMDEILKGEY